MHNFDQSCLRINDPCDSKLITTARQGISDCRDRFRSVASCSLVKFKIAGVSCKAVHVHVKGARN